MPWREAHRKLTARTRALPALLREAAARPLEPARIGLGEVRRVVATGVGGSAAPARLLAHLLAEHLGCDARFRPIGAFFESPPPGACDDLLVVVSQGLTPNARLALADPAAWRHVVLLTATRAGDARAAGRADAADALEHLDAIGVEVRPFAAGSEEYGTLVRVTGPTMGMLAALRYAEALAATVGREAAVPRCDGATLASSVEAAAARAAGLRALAASGRLAGPLAFVASGEYARLAAHLPARLLEGLLVPLPPIYDLLEVAHGPFQQASVGMATFLALARPDAAREDELLDRFTGMLDPTRHALVRLSATLPMPLALFEHEALVTELVLAGIAAHGVEQARWPGQGRDRPLYAVGGRDEAAASVPGAAPPAAADGASPGFATAASAAAGPPGGPHAASPPPAADDGRRLGDRTWPELATALAAEPRVALVPLGATEQHGPHLPCATDTWIGDALAARLAARFPEAVVCPTVPFGCSREHAAFPGALDLAPATLAAVLADLVRSLAGAGFAGAFVFSAHGGNDAGLAAMLPALRAAAAPMRIEAFTDRARVAATLARVAAGAGVDPRAAGHHAGEAETSILLALRPASVRTAALAAGYTAAVADPQTLFYPSLRDRAPTGVVGDPRGAHAARADAYLDAWVDLLADAYLRAKNAP
ncbi:MAG: creatininase family protein [Deltaproteobacteria bacterium]|nr:creatininase family protein [Deltaproteobacteria bacterium]